MASRRVVIPVAVAGMLVVAAGGVGAYATVRGPSGSYRTAVAGLRSVDATLSATGTVGPASSATVAFPIAGTVDSVPVAVGDAVAANATLATVDATALTAALNRAQSTLAQAKLTLEQDQAGAGTATTATTVAFFTAKPATGTGLSVPAAQRAVEEAQVRADAALSTADGDLAAATTACSGTQGPSGFSGETPSASPSPAPSPSATPTAPAGGDSVACLAALQKVLADQTATQKAQQDVSAAQKALTTALADEAASTPSKPGTSKPGGSTPGGSKPGTGGSTSGTGGSRAGAGGSRAGAGGSTTGASGQRTGGTAGSRSGSGGGAAAGSGSASGRPGRSGSAGGGTAGGGSSARTITPEQLAADQATVDAASAQVAVAQQDLAAATIRSPIAGTVAAVNIQPGDTVAANSSTATIEVIGAGPHVVTVSVDVTKIPSVKAGQHATVRPDGETGALPATVTSVGVAPSTTSGTAYPVTLRFTGSPPDLRDGIGAAATITIAQAQNALAVPTTAVTRTAAGAFVTVLADGKTRRTPVRVGAVGTDYTQITQGITAGTVVVLANLDEAVPSSSTTTRFGPRAALVTRGG